MALQKTDRETILDGATQLFRTRGYHNTSMADLGKSCGLLKGSLYHYFPGKEALGIAVIQRLKQDVRQGLFEPAYDSTKSAHERLAVLADALHKYFRSTDGGCLMGNLALETTTSVPEFGGEIQQFFEEWTEAVAHLLKPHHGRKRARKLAEDAVAQIEGAVMLMRVNGDTRPLKRATKDLKSLLD